jgi:WD40 repeat protein
MEKWRESKIPARRPWLESSFPPAVPLASGMQFQHRAFERPVSGLAISDDNGFIAASTSDYLGLWRLADGFQLDQVEDGLPGAGDLAMSPDSRFLVRGLNAAFSVGGQWLATTSDRIKVHVIDAKGFISNPGETMIAPSREDREGSNYWYEFSDMVWIWDLTRRECVRIINKRESMEGRYRRRMSHESADSVRALAWSPCGNFIAYAPNKGRAIDVVSALTPADGLELDPGTIADSICYSPDGRCLAIGSFEGVVLLLSLQSGRVLQKHNAHQHGCRVLSIRFSDDGSRLLSCGGDGNVIMWRTNPLDVLTIFPHADQVNGAQMTRDGRRIVTISGRTVGSTTGNRVNAITVWSAKSKPFRVELNTPEIDSSLAYDDPLFLSPMGTFIGCIGGYYCSHVLRVPDGAPWMELDGHINGINCIQFDEREWYVATGGGHRDYSVRIWDLRSRDLLRILQGPELQVIALSFSPDSRMIACGYGHPFGESKDNRVRIWDWASGEVIEELVSHGGPVRSFSFSSDGNFLAMGSDDGTTRIRHINQQKEVCELKHTHRICSLSFDTTSAKLAIGSWGLVQVVDTSKRVELWRRSDLQWQYVRIREHGTKIEISGIRGYRRIGMDSGREEFAITAGKEHTVVQRHGANVVQIPFPLEHIKYVEGGFLAGVVDKRVFFGKLRDW